MLIKPFRILMSAAGAPAGGPPSTPAPVAAPTPGAPASPPAGSAPTQPAGGAPPKSPMAGPDPKAPPTAPAPLPPQPTDGRPEGVPEKAWKAVQAAEQAARTERESAAKERAALQADRARLQQLEQAAEQLKQFNQEWEGGDPIAFAISRGFTKEDLARRLIGDGAPSPQEAIRRAEEVARSEVAKIREENEKTRKAFDDYRNQQIIQEYRGGLAKTLQADPKRFGLLMPDQTRALDIALQEATAAAAAGQELTNEEVLDRVVLKRKEAFKVFTSHEAARESLLAMFPQVAPPAASSTPAPPTVPNLAPGSRPFNPMPQRDGDSEMIARVLERAKSMAAGT